MASCSFRVSFLLLIALFSPLTMAMELNPKFYEQTCPNAKEIVRNVVAQAYAKDPRMVASLLRLHFHDCFVKGCDASILLDNSGTIVSEKRSNPNRDSARGFEVIDQIKSDLERECPLTVSCADILALIARDSVVLAGGPNWEVALGRRDSLGASIQGSNNEIPAPNNTFQTILTKFKRQGLDLLDFVTLSGSHTIGDSRCTSFRQRLYNQTGNGQPDQTLDPSYAAQLRTNCPQSGGDQNLFFLDLVTPFKFDNQYYKNLIVHKGLLSSDEVLFAKSKDAMEIVERFASNEREFFDSYAKSIVKMGNISPLVGMNGEIRKICRRINHN